MWPILHIWLITYWTRLSNMYLINACTPMLVSWAEVDAIWDHCSWIIWISVSVRVAILGNEREFGWVTRERIDARHEKTNLKGYHALPRKSDQNHPLILKKAKGEQKLSVFSFFCFGMTTTKTLRAIIPHKPHNTQNSMSVNLALLWWLVFKFDLAPKSTISFVDQVMLT